MSSLETLPLASQLAISCLEERILTIRQEGVFKRPLPDTWVSASAVRQGKTEVVAQELAGPIAAAAMYAASIDLPSIIVSAKQLTFIEDNIISVKNC